MLKKALLFVFVIPLMVQAGKLDRIKRALEDSDYEKTLELIRKAAEKEPFNPGINYFKALLYQTSTFQGFQLDSARLAINKSLEDFKNADEKTIEDLKDDGIDMQRISDLQTKIRDQQFQSLANNLSISNVKVFRSKYPNSIYDEILEYKRDSITFTRVKANPSQKKLNEFINENATSIFLPEAKEILDRLNFEELRSNGKLEDYYQFLIRHPRTSFRESIESYILKHSTLDHSIESYQAFLKLCTSEKLRKKTFDLLYYISEAKESVMNQHPLRDSIARVEKSTSLQLFPTIEKGKFGLVNQYGEQQIPNEYDQIKQDYKCSLNNDNWLFMSKKEKGFIIDKLGNVLLEDVEDYRDLSNGVALVKQSGQTFLYHKSGFKILDEAIEDAEVLVNRWIKVKRNDKSELISFLGTAITETRYDDIYLEGFFWVFEKRGLLAVYTEQLILDELHKKGLSLEFKFDDFETVQNNMFIGFRGNRECLIDENLNFLIPWGEYVIHPDKSGWYLKSDEGYQLYNSLEEDVIDRHFPYLESNNGWLALKTQEDWMLLPRREGILPSRGYDSLKLINDFVCLTLNEETSEVVFSNGNTLQLEQEQLIKTFRHSDFISLRDSREVKVYDTLGNIVISGNFDQVSFLNDALLKVEINKKQGLINAKGETLLQPVFDILDKQEEMIFLLKDQKIGCYDITSKVIFMPKYESRIEKVGANYRAKLDGKYGLFDLEEQTVVDFQYDEIHTWNDSSFRVKNENSYSFINYSQESVLDGIEQMNRLTTDETNEIWKFIKNGKYGLLSTNSGILLEPEFTDIFNIGSIEEPLFFADQHLNKAGFHVVSYVDKKGKLVLAKAYTKEEFDRILCED